ncbi:MAG: hypothetical protein WC302_00790 [Candidatus Paceibacterota bacterium]|jgi:DNA repair exonuclease SbcCD ATPase subunit
MTVQEIADQFAEVSANQKILRQQLEVKSNQVSEMKQVVEDQIQARFFISEAARLTQSRFKEKIESLVTMAVQSVFDRPFKFQLVFERKRNKMECLPIITEMINGKESVYSDMEEDVGGGLIDIVAFASRIVLWSLEKPRSRNTIILDEPMKNMGELISLGGQILREISHKLNFQIILVTHEDPLIEVSDRAYRVTHDGVMSNVELVKGAQVNVEEKTESKGIPVRKLNRRQGGN